MIPYGLAAAWLEAAWLEATAVEATAEGIPVGAIPAGMADGEVTIEDLGSYVFGVEESIEGLRMLEAIALSSHSHKWEPVAR